MATTTRNVILDTTADWIPWLIIIQGKATHAKVWKYIDPDSSEPLALPDPQRPTPASVRTGATTIGELDMTQLTAFQILDSYYKEDMKKLDRIESDLKKLSDHILETVSRANLPYIEGKTDVRSMLIALRTRFKPTDYARKLEVGNKYNRLKSWTKRQPVEDWLQEWEFTINEGKKLQIPEVDGLRPLFDFTTAIGAIDSGYASAQDFAIT